MQSSLALSSSLEAAVQAAHAGAAILQAYATNRSELVIDVKMRNDLVSQADREAELAVIDILRSQTPDFGIIAEESGGQASGLASWCIDPLDGTTNFLHGIPHYAVSIALIAHAGTRVNGETLTQDTPVVGVIYDPNREEIFTAMLGAGAWLNGQRIYCSQADSLANSVLATGFPFRDFSFADQYMPTLQHAITHTRGIRRHGAAALDLAWVACGRFDGYWEMGLAPWDVAAGTLLVREAGGICDDMYEQLPWPSNGYVYSGGPVVANELLAMLQPHLKYP
ncbi:MAG TPA: inositol monophosphatase [Alcaligenaceae bacterium]|nr:inositol monophosphatase [Alcaligenaceae bacterium]